MNTVPICISKEEKEYIPSLLSHAKVVQKASKVKMYQGEDAFPKPINKNLTQMDLINELIKRGKREVFIDFFRYAVGSIPELDDPKTPLSAILYKLMDDECVWEEIPYYAAIDDEFFIY